MNGGRRGACRNRRSGCHGGLRRRSRSGRYRRLSLGRLSRGRHGEGGRVRLDSSQRNGCDVPTQLRHVDNLVRHVHDPHVRALGHVYVVGDLHAAGVIRHGIEMEQAPRNDARCRCHGSLEVSFVQPQLLQRERLALRILSHQRKKLAARLAEPEKRLRAEHGNDVRLAEGRQRQTHDRKHRNKKSHAVYYSRRLVVSRSV